MKYYSIGEFANKIGKTIQTLRNWGENGSLKPAHITKGGTRYYSQEQLNHFLGLKSKTKLNKKTIGYCRVSSHKQKDDLERQVEVGTARFIYNWTLSKQEENYKNGGKFISDEILRKELTQLKKSELSWLNEVSNNVAKQAVKDAYNVYKRLFNGLSYKPRFKSRKKE